MMADTREDVVPCPACDGSGVAEFEWRPRENARGGCDFCGGIGAVTPAAEAPWFTEEPDTEAKA